MSNEVTVKEIWSQLTPQAKARLETLNPEVPTIIRQSTPRAKAVTGKAATKRVSPWRGRSLRARIAILVVGGVAYLLQATGWVLAHLAAGASGLGAWAHDAKWRIGK